MSMDATEKTAEAFAAMRTALSFISRMLLIALILILARSAHSLVNELMALMPIEEILRIAEFISNFASG
jgi:hypothetical protein